MNTHFAKTVCFLSIMTIFLLNCAKDKSPIESESEAPQVENFITLIEIQRYSVGKKNNDSTGYLTICCQLWKFDDGVLIYPNPGSIEDEVKMLVLMRHQINGDIGFGEADQVVPIKKFPSSVPIITFFWNSDTLYLSSLKKSGAISAYFKGKNFILEANSKIQFSSTIVADILDIGSFSINDTINIINHGNLITKNF